MPERDHKQRLIALEGAMNCRDLGGYRTVDGSSVRWRRVYRSDNLHEITEADLAVLGALGIALVIDLRNAREVAETPSRFPHPGLPDVEWLHLPMGEDVEGIPMTDRALAGEYGDRGIEMLVAEYLRMLDDHAEVFGEVVARASESDERPLLYHCVAGKDRTGLASALILGALGVPDEDLVMDYELTTEYRSAKRLAARRAELEAQGLDVEAALPFLTAMAPVMVGALDALRAEHGSIEGYLTGRAGLRSATLDRLRRVLLG